MLRGEFAGEPFALLRDHLGHRLGFRQTLQAVEEFGDQAFGRVFAVPKDVLQRIQHAGEGIRQRSGVVDPHGQNRRSAVGRLRNIVCMPDLKPEHLAVNRRLGDERNHRVSLANLLLDVLCPFHADLKMAVNEHIDAFIAQGFLQHG